jgi:sulfur carrier protein
MIVNINKRSAKWGTPPKGCYFVLCFFCVKKEKEVNKMKVNGTFESLEQSKTLYEYLTDRNFDLTKIAVERNGHIVPKAEYQNVNLENEDTLEIVRFVGGG